MFVPHHLPPALLAVWLVFSLFCVVVLATVAATRGQTRLHAVWGLLGLPGLGIGLLIMLALPVGVAVGHGAQSAGSSGGR